MNNKKNTFKDQEIIDDEIAIIGIGFRIPSGSIEKSHDNNIDLWLSLLNKFDGVIETKSRWSSNFNKTGDISSKYAALLPMDDWKLFDSLFFGISPKDTPIIDPQQRLLLKCVWEALEDSLIDPMEIRGSDTSCFMGCSNFDFHNVSRSTQGNVKNIFNMTPHTVSNRVSYCFDLHGPSMTVDTACSSSLNAISLGYQSIKYGKSKISLVGGVNFMMDPYYSKSYSTLEINGSSGKCKVFDADADGYVRAEGVGIVVLKSLKQAQLDGNNIYCVIKGENSNEDGSTLKNNFYSPCSQSQADNIKLAFESTNCTVSPRDIRFVEAHGTGTPTGDPIETKGISEALNTINNRSPLDPLLIGSFKSNIGHGEAASGVLSLIKCCLMFKNQCIAPNIHFNSPNPNIKFDEWNLKVVTDAIPFSNLNNPNNKPISMLLNSFGITGSNCCLILSEPLNTNNKNSNNNINDVKHNTGGYLVPISANSVSSLKKLQSLIFNQSLKGSSNSDFSKLLYQLIFSKSSKLHQRSILVAKDINDINESNLITPSKHTSEDNTTSSILSVKNKPSVVYVFPGQGPQWSGMGSELYNSELIFKESIDEIDLIFSKLNGGYSILEKLRSIDENDKTTIHYPSISTPAILMIQISLYKLLKYKWDIIPSIIVGHSFGEIVSSYCAGMVDLETVCLVTYHRAMEQEKLSGTGKMLSIAIDELEFTEKYLSNPKYSKLEIACFNSDSSIVIGGTKDLLDSLVIELNENNIFSVFLGSHTAYHTSSQEAIKDSILSYKHFKSNLPTTPIFSTVTTNLYYDQSKPESNKLFNWDYVYENMRKPVHFCKTISNILDHIKKTQPDNDNIIFVELSPHPTLAYYLKQIVSSKSTDGKNVSVLTTIKKKSSDNDEINKTVSQCYLNGYNVNFKNQFSAITISKNNNEIIAPIKYQFDERSYWKELPIESKNFIEKGPTVDILGYDVLETPLTQKTSVIDINSEPYKWLKGHLVRSDYYFTVAGYIDNIINSFENKDIIIGSLEFKEPFILGSSRNVNFGQTQNENKSLLSTSIYQTSNSLYKVLFHFKHSENISSKSKNNEWILSSIGSIILLDKNGIQQKKNRLNGLEYLQKLKLKCNFSTVYKSDFYKHILQITGLHYSKEFEIVKHCSFGNNCSLSIVSIPSTRKDLFCSSPSSFLNTLIIDGCLHGMIGSIQTKSKILLDNIKDMKIYSSKFPSQIEFEKVNHVVSYSKFKNQQGNNLIFSLKVMIPNGKIIFEAGQVILISLIDIPTSSLNARFPSESIYSSYLQLIDSPVDPKNDEKLLSILKRNRPSSNFISNSDINKSIVTSFYYHYINGRNSEITIDVISKLQLEQLIDKFSNKNNTTSTSYNSLFKYVFRVLKNNVHLIINDKEQLRSVGNNMKGMDFVSQSCKISSRILFPLLNDEPLPDQPNSLNGILDQFYSNSNALDYELSTVGELIKESLLPIVNEKAIIRIIEFGGNTGSLSIKIIDSLNKLYDSNCQLDIEFTFTDKSNSIMEDVKKKLSHFKGSLIFKTIDISNELVDDNRIDDNPLYLSFYDFVVMSNVLNGVENIKFKVDELYKILKPNGQLIFVEPPFKSIVVDSTMGIFDKWWSFDDNDIRSDFCCMSVDSWSKLFKECGFVSFSSSNQSQVYNPTSIKTPLLTIKVKKPSFINCKDVVDNSGSLIIFGNSMDNIDSNSFKFTQSLKKQNSAKNIIEISDLNVFKSLSNELKDGDLIYFIKTIEILTIENYKSITMEYTNISQLLIDLKLKTKFILISYESNLKNYLSSSITGMMRYFETISKNVELVGIDFDEDSLTNKYDNGFDNIQITISKLINFQSPSSNEYIIVNGKPHFERYKQELNIKNSFKNCSSFALENELSNKFNPINLTNQTIVKKELLPGFVEIKVESFGLTKRDYRISNEELVVLDGYGIGLEYSGVITRIGVGSKISFKVGDQVFGIAKDCSLDYLIMDSKSIVLKPKNIKHFESASIPLAYIKSLYSIYEIGNFNNKLSSQFNTQEKESILIHNCTDSIGLATLEILKWKQCNSYIFVTVESDEKEQFLTENYGELITGIYSSTSDSFVKGIKLKLNELGSIKDGVDIILNIESTSSYIMDSNFKCLSTHGKIIDLSNESCLDIDKFKTSSISKIDITKISPIVLSGYLNIISFAIESDKLKLIPVIIEYKFSEIKEAIENFGQIDLIGKVVINRSTIKENKMNETNNINTNIMKPNYQYNLKNLGKTILFTGQTGVVLEVIKWVVSNSKTVESIIILSKSSINWKLQLLINKTLSTIDNKIKFYFRMVDVSNLNMVDDTQQVVKMT